MQGPQGAARGLIKNQSDTDVTRGKDSMTCTYDLYQFACFLQETKNHTTLDAVYSDMLNILELQMYS